MSGQPSVSGGATFFQLFLDVAHRVITKITRQPAAKTRQTGAQGHLETLLVIADEIERVLRRGFDDLAVVDDFGARLRAKARRPHQRARRQADKAVAAKAFAAHHRFQQKAVLAAVFGESQFQIQRQRGFEVGKRFNHQRNAVVALAGQAFKFKFSDHEGVLHGRQAP